MQGTGREARKSAVCIFGISKEIDRYSSRRSAVGCSNYYKEKKKGYRSPQPDDKCTDKDKAKSSMNQTETPSPNRVPFPKKKKNIRGRGV